MSRKGRKPSLDPKVRVYINARRSLLCKIEEVSYMAGITKTDVLALCLENSLPMLENLAKKVELSKIVKQ